MVQQKIAQRPISEREETSQTEVQVFSGSYLRRIILLSGTLVLQLLSLTFWFIGLPQYAHWTLFAILLLGGIPLLLETIQRLWKREVGVDLIALLAIAGSLFFQQYLAGAIIVLMMVGGETLEAYALRRARSSLTALVQHAPCIAHIWQNDRFCDIPADRVEVGMVVVVKPGEVLPVDGIIEKGTANLSEADLTGEPLPIHKGPGSLVFSGSVSLDNLIEVRATRRSAESQYAQIVQLVKAAQERKAPIHRLADRYSVVFTAVTLIIALAAWFFSGQGVYALAVLVVATPCPLILATPIAIMSGIDSAARQAIIVKSGATIEQLGEVNVVVFDKTGTLTMGRPLVSSFLSVQQCDAEEAEREALYYTASVEQLSTHILARAFVEAAQERGIELEPANHFQEIFGKGVSGQVPAYPQKDGSDEREQEVMVAVGNRTFMRLLEIPLPETLLREREQRTEQGQLGSFLALDGKCVGLLVLEDVPRSDLNQLVPSLKREEVQYTVLLTGDSEKVATQIGRQAGVDQIQSRCLPEQKVDAIKALLAQGKKVLMVGDGVNDAPALATATVGLALGTQGMTAASHVADAVLLSGDILRVATAVHIGKHVMRVATQGIWIGIGLSLVAMIFAAMGFIPPAMGALLQEGIDVLVILNALRAAVR
uniref:Cation transporter n=1 Tax=Thermosporothrix sp. COM3 TaxID=2490863 RepID=A0A455SJR9_9CHLR|nr:cation transporter [Thermosporothrix sp. COM3]